eukprot:XP_001692280.1 predicted protein [Chlamydomonas reinhardtii]
MRRTHTHTSFVSQHKQHQTIRCALPSNYTPCCHLPMLEARAATRLLMRPTHTCPSFHALLSRPASVLPLSPQQAASMSRPPQATSLRFRPTQDSASYQSPNAAPQQPPPPHQAPASVSLLTRAP